MTEAAKMPDTQTGRLTKEPAEKIARDILRRIEIDETKPDAPLDIVYARTGHPFSRGVVSYFGMETLGRDYYAADNYAEYRLTGAHLKVLCEAAASAPDLVKALEEAKAVLEGDDPHDGNRADVALNVIDAALSPLQEESK